MGRWHAHGQLSPLRNEGIADAMDKKLLKVPENRLDMPVDLHREIGGNGSLDGAVDFGRAGYDVMPKTS